jgi:hypothetical protein
MSLLLKEKIKKLFYLGITGENIEKIANKLLLVYNQH